MSACARCDELELEVARLRKMLRLDEPAPVMERAHCTWCGDEHPRARKPRDNERTFCPRCRAAGVPVRLAQRDRRARLRG